MQTSKSGRQAHPLSAVMAMTVLAAALTTAQAWAQVSAERTFDIAAQPLTTALIMFGQQSGLQVTVHGTLPRDISAPTVRGSMTRDRALTRLLAGSGLTYVFADETTVAIEKPGRQGADRGTVLDPITVEGGTSGRSYDASTSVVRGNRLGQTLLETPRAVSVVTRSILDDQQPDNEVDVLRNVSGVNRTNDFQGVYQRFQLRGIDADNAYTYLRDGYRFTHQSDPGLYNIERIEVIKGPNAIDFGQSAPGGFINYVTKKPLDQERYALELTGGSFDQYQGTMDLTGPLNKDKTILYRLTAGYESGGAFTDHLDPLRRGVAGALSWSITPRTKLNVTGDYQKTERLANPGWPVPDPFRLESANALPDSAFYGDANLEFDMEERRYSAELLHDFSDDWRFRAMFAQDHLLRDNNFISLRGLTNDGTETTRLLFQRLGSERDSITARADVRGSLRTASIQHDIVIGADYYRFETTDKPFLIVALPNLTLFNPPLTATQIPVNTGETFSEKDTAYGFFVQDSIDFGRGWGLQLGIRRDVLENDETSEEVSQTSPNAAITYAPTKHSLIYASYSSSFEPNWGVDLLDGGVADPSEGEQFEVGFKQGWLDGRFTTTAALFALTKSNIVVGDPQNPGFDIVTGEVEVKGVELEAAGKLLPGLNLLAQVTLLDTEITSDTDETVIGNRLPGSVEMTASLWATYQLPGDLYKWTIGGGIFYTGDRVLNDRNTLSLPSYTTVDAFVGYQISDAISAQLNVTNIADKRYYVNASTSGDTFRSTFPGEPRAVSLTLRASF
ncbi:MAG: TonB-dependent receptor [Hyphomicrobiales bacterium]|nr:TonB-dependent receptor [Hyphomicrobiales bacterium]